MKFDIINRRREPNWQESDHETWRKIIQIQASRRNRQALSIFEDGLNAIGMDEEKIPNLAVINKRLRELTGWQGVYVEGLEKGPMFYAMLSNREFPIGAFIRSKNDLSYTPAPDVVHDLYGHIPFLANREYADFSQRFGAAAIKAAGDSGKFQEFERLYWFTMEFGLIKTPQGRRIFGAGVLSSVKESEFALSAEPEVRPFDEKNIRAQEFRIDQIQKILFELNSVEQLYSQILEN